MTSDTERQSSSQRGCATHWDTESLRAFEESIRQEYLAGRAKGAVHLSRGNEAQLIEVFKNIKRTDWVFATYRAHYHALLHGVPAGIIPVPRKQDDSHETMQVRSAEEDGAANLFRLPQCLYAELEKVASSNFVSEKEGQLQELRWRISEKGQTPEAAMQDMWGSGYSDASRELRHAIARGLAVPEASLGIACQRTVISEILAGNSINLNFPGYRFYTSSIVGGCLPIAVGTALAIKRRGGDAHVWCFVGDMAASCGMFHDCANYAGGFDLPLTFVVEDNGYSTNTPTHEVWGNPDNLPHIVRYKYVREWPHSGFKL